MIDLVKSRRCKLELKSYYKLGKFNVLGNVIVMQVPPDDLGVNRSPPSRESHTLKANGIPRPVPNRLVVGALMALGSGVNGMPLPLSSNLKTNPSLIISSCISM